MRKILVAAITVAALGAVACSDVDSPTAVHSGSEGAQSEGAQYENNVKQAGSDIYNGPTYVLGGFSLTVEGSGEAFEPGANAHPQGLGECRDESGDVNEIKALNTVWHGPGQSGADTSAKFCEGTEGDAEPLVLACTIDAPGIPATYAAQANNPGEGNENLNFLTDEEGDVDDQFVHYNSQHNETSAKGDVEFAYSCESEVTGVATIDLSLWNVAGSVFVERDEDSRQLEIDGQTVGTDLGDGEMESLYWVFRSRVGDE